MWAAALLVALAQAPAVDDSDARVIVVPIPSSEPAPAPAPVPVPVPAPAPVPVEQQAPIPPPLTAPPPVVDAGVPLAAPPVALTPAPAPAPQQKVIEATPLAPPEAPKSGLMLRVGIESGTTSWPSGSPLDLLLFVRPLVSFDAGDDFAADIGATFNLRIFDDPPENRSNDIGGVLRREDWDEPSDFGQIIKLLRIAKSDGPAWARAGAVKLKTLGNGHLITRYSNQDNPDYHPASGAAGLLLGPVRGEFFASDIFGARLFAGLLGIELGRLLSNDKKWHDRFWVQLELAHDVGEAGGPVIDTSTGARLRTPSATLMHLDATAMLYRSASSQLMLLLGGGTRIQSTRADFGAVLGLSLDSDLDGFLLGGKLEARKNGGGFRQGYFGPQYELSRFVGAGFSGVPQAMQLLPDSFSFYGELRLGRRGFLVFEAAAEYFIWGRTELDLSLQAELFSSRLVTTARFTGVALGVLPRYAFTADARVRVTKAFYVVGAGGTVFFPQTDGTLFRGVFISVGVGLDFETAL